MNYLELDKPFLNEIVVTVWVNKVEEGACRKPALWKPARLIRAWKRRGIFKTWPRTADCRVTSVPLDQYTIEYTLRLIFGNVTRYFIILQILRS